MASTALTGSGFDSRKLACISGRYFLCSRRAVSQSLFRAARVISAISRGISFEATEIIPAPPSERTRLYVGAGTSGNVVKNDWLLDRLGNGAEMAILAFLCGFVVIGRGGENCVYPRTRRGLLRFRHRFVSRV